MIFAYDSAEESMPSLNQRYREMVGKYELVFSGEASESTPLATYRLSFGSG